MQHKKYLSTDKFFIDNKLRRLSSIDSKDSILVKLILEKDSISCFTRKAIGKDGNYHYIFATDNISTLLVAYLHTFASDPAYMYI